MIPVNPVPSADLRCVAVNDGPPHVGGICCDLGDGDDVPVQLVRRCPLTRCLAAAEEVDPGAPVLADVPVGVTTEDEQVSIGDRLAVDESYLDRFAGLRVGGAYGS